MSETAVINTPDQRLRVFVSSTLQELAAERRAVQDAVTRLRYGRLNPAAGALRRSRAAFGCRPSPYC